MKQPATLLIAALVAFASTAVARAGSPADELAGQIKNQVYQFVNEGPSTGPSPSVAEFGRLVSTASWSEIWPNAGGGEVAQTVTAGIWNNAIQATLDKYGTVYLPKSATPYYIDDPIVLKSGQRLSTDPDTEIRLRPGVNTCMVRNEHIVSGQSGPLPATKLDSGIVVEGDIWTTLATSPTQSNGNSRGRSDQQGSVPGSHGVILMSNVDGLVTRDLTIRQSMAHGLQVSNCSNFLVDGIRFDEHRRDGVHINGSASYGVIRNIRGDTYDDFVALNGWDWLNATPTFGRIDHILVEDIHGNPLGNSSDEIRLLPDPNTTPAGGTGKVKLIGCLISASIANRSFEAGIGNSESPTDWMFSGNVRVCQEVATLGGLGESASGSDVMQLNAGDGTSVFAYQDLPTEFVAGTEYALTMALGMRNDHIGHPAYADVLDWVLSFNYADTGEELARLSGTLLNDAIHTGFLSDQMLRYLANPADVGHGIQIRIFASTEGKNSGGAAAYGLLTVDNVRLEGTAVPEPCALILLGMAILGLFAYTWQQRGMIS